MLAWRLTLGVLLAAVLGALCFLDVHAARPATWLLPVALAITAAAAGEMLSLLGARGYQPVKAVVIGGSLLIVASTGVPIFWPSAGGADPLARLAWPTLALTLCTIWAFVAEMRRYDQPGQVAVNLGLAILSLVYVGLLMSFLVQLRAIGQAGVGMLALVSLLAVAKAGDIGAYTVGRLVGRHKLAPALSPGKTIEGAAGAIAFSCATAAVIFGLLMPRMFSISQERPWWGWLIFGVTLSVAGLLGDLSESLLKRDLGRKDSSVWMPGFGGVLDIIDSVLIAAPVAYICWLGGLVGP